MWKLDQLSSSEIICLQDKLYLKSYKIPAIQSQNIFNLSLLFTRFSAMKIPTYCYLYFLEFAKVNN